MARTPGGGGGRVQARSRRAGAGDVGSHRWQRLHGVVIRGALVRVLREPMVVRRRVRLLTLPRVLVGRRAVPPRGQPGKPSGNPGPLHRVIRGAFCRHRPLSGGPASRLGVRDGPESDQPPAPWQVRGISRQPRDRGGRAGNVDPSFPATVPFDERSARDEREGSASPRPRLRVRDVVSRPARTATSEFSRWRVFPRIVGSSPQPVFFHQEPRIPNELACACLKCAGCVRVTPLAILGGWRDVVRERRSILQHENPDLRFVCTGFF